MWNLSMQSCGAKLSHANKHQTCLPKVLFHLDKFKKKSQKILKQLFVSDTFWK